MSVLQKVSAIQQPDIDAQASQRRFFILCALLICSIIFDIIMRLLAPGLHSPFSDTIRFLFIWGGAWIPYLVACLFVLLTPVPQGRWFWREMSVILVGALLLRLILLPIFPFLSHDILRYIWDALVTLHGYSPYTTIPDSPALVPLRDPLFYKHMGYQTVPTLYPPGAQVVYIIGYLLGGHNVVPLKTIFMLFDMTTCVALAFLLQKRGLDPRRCVIYAWAPVVITEFAIQGHVDVLPITFSVLAILCAYGSWRGSRAMTGFFIGMATVTKIYPIVLLIVVIRRRDYALLATCALTILAFYTPYLIAGHGNAFGFFSTYADQAPTNQSIVPLFLFWLGSIIHLSWNTNLLLIHGVDVIIAGTVSLLMLYLRWRERISMEAAFLILTGTIFSISSHIFPWYTTALLPWIAMLAMPLRRWTAGKWQISYNKSHALAVATAWYFTFGASIGYFFIPTNDWRLYYLEVYDVTLLGLLLAAGLGIQHFYSVKMRQGITG